jgi:nitronate monooxygenase
MKRTRVLCDQLGIELPIIQAPMAGANDQQLAVAVAEAGGLGSLPCAMLKPEAIGHEVASFRQRTARPINVNFFCHRAPEPDASREAQWQARLRPYYAELGVSPPTTPGLARAPFDDALCAIVEAVRPEVVSFHFGLPERTLLERVRATGATIISSATSVAEARYLEEGGCHAIIAQGAEAGGHRGMFLSDDVSAQIGTFALVPQVVDAVKVPVIAAGGIADGRGIVAALALGASVVQIGTAYLRCPEATISAVHRAALAEARDDSTRITNVFTGRPARGIENRVVRELGPLNEGAPAFPNAAAALAPLRAKAESRGDGGFSQLWSGQAVPLTRPMGAAELTRRLAREAFEILRELAPRDAEDVAGRGST